MSEAVKRVAIYTRISLERAGEESASPAQQEAECRKLAEQRGWSVQAVYSDRNVSASRDAIRPQFDRLMADVRTGRFDVVMAWERSRLTRRGVRGISAVLDALAAGGADLVTVVGHIDGTTPMGQGMLALLASVDAEESLRISQRVSRDEAARATVGKVHGGGRRCYGYTRSGELVPEEAEHLREAAGRVVAGESLRSVVRDLNARGIRTTSGKEWQEFPLRRLLRSPRLVAVREHKGQTFPASWPAILTAEEHEAVCVALAGRSPGPPGRFHLLSGLLVCGRCNRPMRHRTSGRPARHVYACQPDAGRGSCGKVSAGEQAVDAVVVEHVLSFLSRAHLAPVEGARSSVDELDEAVAADERALVELGRERFVTRTLTAEEYGPVRAELAERLERKRAELATALAQVNELSGALEPGSREDLDAWWSDADDQAKREAIRRVVESVTVAPAARRGGNRFDPARVQVRRRTGVYRLYFEKLSAGELDHLATEDDVDPGNIVT